MISRNVLIGLLVALLVVSAGCGLKDDIDESRGRGDAGVGAVDDGDKEVIQFPDRFSNVAHACDGHGHRVYVTTKSDQSRFMAVIDDPGLRVHRGLIEMPYTPEASHQSVAGAVAGFSDERRH